MSVSLTLKNISRSYIKDNEKFFAVQNVNLEVKPGEFLTFLGPSGCGKTTTLRMIAGFETPTEGQILLGDKDVTKIPANERGMGFVFQNYALYPHMTVYDNMAFGLKLRKVPKAEQERLVKDAAKILDLEQLLDRKPKALSGGQRQALTLLMATMNCPKLLLLDEHTAALDPATADKVLEITKEVVEKNHITTLMVSHIMQQALNLGNRILMMDSGRIVFDVQGEEKKSMTTDDLLRQFQVNAGKALDNDRILLSND